MQPTFPLQTIGIYAIVLLILSVISGAIPGYQASKIAPSQALRYSG